MNKKIIISVMVMLIIVISLLFIVLYNDTIDTTTSSPFRSYDDIEKFYGTWLNSTENESEDCLSSSYSFYSNGLAKNSATTWIWTAFYTYYEDREPKESYILELENNSIKENIWINFEFLDDNTLILSIGDNPSNCLYKIYSKQSTPDLNFELFFVDGGNHILRVNGIDEEFENLLWSNIEIVKTENYGGNASFPDGEISLGQEVYNIECSEQYFALKWIPTNEIIFNCFIPD